MKRFTLGSEFAVGWMIFDGINMSTHYYGAETKEEAQAYVDYRNLIDTIRLRQLRDEARAKVAFYAALEGIQRNAA